MLHLGTSGFSYSDWVGPFYPAGMPKKDWLVYYAREFSACEVNSTYYAIPRPQAVEAMAQKTGEGFLFAVKANRAMTHEQGEGDDAFRAFREALLPLVERGRLGCVLAQFPYSFRFNTRNRDYVEEFAPRLEGLPLVVEMRNAQWVRPEVFDWLRGQGIGFCCVDEPPLPGLMPPVAIVTSDVAYVRFHGRNSEKWWRHEHAYERYDYSYSQQELEEWLPRLRHLDAQAERTFVFANNHWRGQAVDTIRQLRLLLE